MRNIILLFIISFLSGVAIQNDDEQAMQLEIKEFALANVDTLVDIGCQDGEFSREIARAYPNLYLILEDLETYKLCTKGGTNCMTVNTKKQVTKKFKNSKKYPNVAGRYTFIAGEIDSIPLATAAFKRVLCRRTVHEFVQQQKMVSELKRILSSNGMLTIVEAEPNYPNQVDIFCNKRYLTKNEVIELFKDFQLDSFKTIQYGNDKMNIYNFRKQNW
jgi:ubiquinone/menaquinone biosynthesis C-methylase UbiE